MWHYSACRHLTSRRLTLRNSACGPLSTGSLGQDDVERGDLSKNSKTRLRHGVLQIFRNFQFFYWLARPLLRLSATSKYHICDSLRGLNHRQVEFEKNKNKNTYPSQCLAQANERKPHESEKGFSLTQPVSGRRQVAMVIAPEPRAPTPCQSQRATAKTPKNGYLNDAGSIPWPIVSHQ